MGLHGVNFSLVHTIENSLVDEQTTSVSRNGVAANGNTMGTVEVLYDYVSTDFDEDRWESLPDGSPCATGGVDYASHTSSVVGPAMYEIEGRNFTPMMGGRVPARARLLLIHAVVRGIGGYKTEGEGPTTASYVDFMGVIDYGDAYEDNYAIPGAPTTELLPNNYASYFGKGERAGDAITDGAVLTTEGLTVKIVRGNHDIASELNWTFTDSWERALYLNFQADGFGSAEGRQWINPGGAVGVAVYYIGGD